MSLAIQSTINNAKRYCLVAVTLLISACGGSGSDAIFTAPGPYAADDLWACKPGVIPNLCLELDQTTTFIHSNTSREVIAHTPVANASFDCFYVHPTTDMREEPGNMLEFNDETRALIFRPLYNQAARFTQLCNVYAPYYKQMTIGTYGAPGGYRGTDNFKLAYNDVEQAFKQYLLENPNRKFVLMGHSQGSHMLLELLAKHFDNDAAMRQRLISALLIGPVGALEVPTGQVAGGTFQNIPLCSHASDNACIVAFDSVASGGLAGRTTPAQPRPCVNPTTLGGNNGILENMYYGTLSGIPLPAGVDSPFVAFPNLQTAECEADGFLAIGTVVEERIPPFSPQLIQAVLGGTLHQADINYTLGDLLRVVSVQAGL